MTRPSFSVTLTSDLKIYPACGEEAHINSSNTVVANVSSETVSGTSRRKPVGFIPPTAYSLEARRVDYPKGTCEFYPGSGLSKHVYGSFYKGIVGTSSVGGRFNGNSRHDSTLTESSAKADDGLRNAALIAVRNNLKSTSVNLGVAFGERNQTARLLGDTAIRLSRAVRKLRRGEIRRAMDELGISSRRRQPRGSNVPQKWLELQYGWKPLLSDVYGATKALENRPKGDWRVTAKATRSTESSNTFVVTPTLGGGYGGGTCRAVVKKSVFARIDALPQNEAIISLASLGVTNPLSVAWELVPFSFVVDWVTPIGGFLESLDALLGYGGNYYSSSLLVRARWIDSGLSASAGTWYNRNTYSGRKKLVYLSRSVSTNTPLPTLPGIKDPRSLGHMANGLALMATVFGRR
jgi:hypothetical protein